eukprot:s173_g34.t1
MQCLGDDLERFSRLSGRKLQDALQINLEDWKQHPREAAQVWRKIAQQKQIQKSLQVLRFLYHHRVEAADAISFNMAMAASAKASSWQSSFEYLELLQQSQVRATTVTFNTVVNVYEQASKWQLGLGLKDSIRMAAVLPDAAMLNICTNTCARLRKWQNAIQVLEDGSNEIENVAFNAALTSVASDRWSVGQCLFTNMLSLRIPPDGFTYSALANVSPWQDAFHATSHSKVEYVEYDAVLCGALLASCETHWALAVQFLHGMQGCRLADAVAINSAINSADKSHRWELALLLLGSMSGATRSDAYSFSSAIGCLTWKFAFSLLSHMPTREVKANLVCLNAAISACEKQGAWREALDLLQSKRLGCDTTSFNTVISACSRAKNWPMAIAILKVMARDNIAQDAISFRAAISACEGGNCWKEALNLLTEMQSRLLRPETTGYNAAISACEKGSQWELALGMSARALQKAVSLDVITFNANIAACRSTWRTTQELLRELRLQLLQLDEITYNSAICAQGHWRKAIAYLSGMADYGLGRDVITCNSILQTMQISGPKWHAVCLLLDHIQDRATAITFELLLECVSPRQKVLVLHALQADVLTEAGDFLREKSAPSISKQDI